jgi:hypothetical protein
MRHDLLSIDYVQRTAARKQTSHAPIATIADQSRLQRNRLPYCQDLLDFAKFNLNYKTTEIMKSIKEWQRPEAIEVLRN